MRGIFRIPYYNYAIILHFAFQERWAFEDDEAQSELEKSLAPRQYPSFRFFRVAILALSTWVLVLGSISFTLITLVYIGRTIYAILLFAVPQKLGITLHDPLCVVIGIQTACSFYRTFSRFSEVLRQGNIIFSRIPLRGHIFCK